jgi:light-regulated signal transduction histidine kinase (bacteriophytochrome)
MTINTDITAAKTASVHLAQRRAELEVLNEKLRRSNEDLEQFAYVASHDLSEPLRAISGPISLLARRYQGRLDAEADEFIGFAVDGCDRMQVLINDLLAYSRVGRRDSELSSVDMDSVLERALGGLQPVIAARHAVITSDRLPRIQARASQLTSLLQNLISNAIKYCAPGVVPRIHVGYADEGAFLRFSVTDNGIGIDVEHRERIFGMFKRLHTREAYAGTGIGLAVCKKIVESNGGHIGVSGGPDGSGSRFWFTLPNREDQRE